MHTATDPLQFSVPLQTQIAPLDPELPVSDVLTMNQIIGASLVNASLSATRVGLTSTSAIGKGTARQMRNGRMLK